MKQNENRCQDRCLSGKSHLIIICKARARYHSLQFSVFELRVSEPPRSEIPQELCSFWIEKTGNSCLGFEIDCALNVTHRALVEHAFHRTHGKRR